MGWGLAGTGISSAVIAAAAQPSRMSVFWKTVSFAIGSKMEDLGAIYYRHFDRTDAAVLFQCTKKKIAFW